MQASPTLLVRAWMAVCRLATAAGHDPRCRLLLLLLLLLLVSCRFLPISTSCIAQPSSVVLPAFGFPMEQSVQRQTG